MTGYQQTCKCKQVYTGASVFAQHIVPEKMHQRMKANAKRGKMMVKIFLMILLKHVCNRNKYTRSNSLSFFRW